VHLPGLAFVTDDACYRAMDELIGVQAKLTRQVYDQLANLLNLEVDLLFLDYPANRRCDFVLAA